MSPRPAPSRRQVRLAQAQADATVKLRVRAERSLVDLQRTDHINAILAATCTALFLMGGAAVGVTSRDGTFPEVAQQLIVAGMAALAGAVVMLGWSMRARGLAPGRASGGVPRYARMSAQELYQEAACQPLDEYYLEMVLALSRIAYARQRAQNGALLALLAAFVLLLVAVEAVVIAG